MSLNKCFDIFEIHIFIFFLAKKQSCSCHQYCTWLALISSLPASHVVSIFVVLFNFLINKTLNIYILYCTVIFKILFNF